MNTEATLNLALQHSCVKRFVFISTIKVNGEGRDEPYPETDVPVPVSYAIISNGKPNRAERIAADTGLEVVTVIGCHRACEGEFPAPAARGCACSWPLPLG